MKPRLLIHFLFSFLVSFFSLNAYSENRSNEINYSIDSSIQSLASLTYHANALYNQVQIKLFEKETVAPSIEFSGEEVDHLWKKASSFIQYSKNHTFKLSKWIQDFEIASIH